MLIAGRRLRLLESKSLKSWTVIGLLITYIALSLIVYTFTVEPLYGALHPFGIEADSGAYFAAAGIGSAGPENISSQVSLGGSVLGPAAVATIFRTRFGVALFNIALLLISILVARSIPGIRAETFTLLLMANALTLPAIATLNKEILALAGVVLFAKYLYAKRYRLLWLWTALILSTMARWQQTVFILIFMTMQSRRSPVRGKPRWALSILIAGLSVAWALISIRFSNLLVAYTALQAEITTGTVARLNSLQSKGLFFLVVWPKILMNIAGRLLQVSYFLNEWIYSDFHDLQNTVIGNLHSVAFLSLLGWMIFHKRFRLARPLVYFTLVYLVLTAVSPLIQNRYAYPAYVLLALELSRRKESLEPVEPLPALPPLPHSYLQGHDYHADADLDLS